MDAGPGGGSAGPGPSQEAVIRFLSDPRTYGVDRVDTAETHGSIVFLAGARALKLKRAVRYSYLDYSTPERRRAACEAECDINRRFAPSLYRGVEAVVRGEDGTIRLGGAGVSLDWVVVMRRFDQSAQFDRMAESGRLTPALMIALADRLVRLHREAPVRPDEGGAAGLRRALEMTAQNLRSETQGIFPAEAVESWSASAWVCLAEQAGLLERRRAEGKVRACHGDLHLRNICLLDGEPTPFDAIEFDPRLSAIDVLYDLAFLLMDSHGRGLDRLGNALFNRYLDLADEADGLPALPLLLSLRAAIRAMVAATAAHTVAGQGAGERQAEAIRYLALANELIAGSGPPPSVAIGGLSGTGKSSLAYALAPALGRAPGARVLRTDVLRKRRAGLMPEARLPPSAYTPASHAETYRALADAAGLCLRAGHGVIADAVFGTQAERALMEGVAAQEGAPFLGIWLTAPAETLRARVSGRAGDASDADPSVLQAQLSWEIAPPPGWHVIESGGALDSVVAAARNALSYALTGAARAGAGSEYRR